MTALTEYDPTATIGAAEVVCDLVKSRLFIANPGGTTVTHEEAYNALYKGLEAAKKLKSGFPSLNIEVLEKLVAEHYSLLGSTEDFVSTDELLDDLMDELVPDRPVQ